MTIKRYSKVAKVVLKIYRLVKRPIQESMGVAWAPGCIRTVNFFVMGYENFHYFVYGI